MSKDMRTIAARTGAVLVEGLDGAVMVAAASVGGWVGYNAPIPFATPAWSAAFAGAFGLALAIGISELLDSFIASLRALTRITSSAPAPRDVQEALPTNPEDLDSRLAQFPLADSAYVQYRYDEQALPKHQYTFVTPETDAEPVTLTTMAQHINRETQEEPVGA